MARKAGVSTRIRAMRMILAMACMLTGIQLSWGISVVSYVTDSDGVTFTCNTGKMKVKICQADIVRVTYTPTSAFPAKTSLCVNKTFATPSFTVTENGDTIVLLTNRIKVKVAKTNATVNYTDLSNTLILSEYDKSMAAATVEGVRTYTINTMFNSPADEGLYGLGQHQIDGGKGTATVNYKGKSSELMDQEYVYIDHFISAIPVLVSTRGYGLFWDNYSKSWFYGNEGSNTRYRYTSECGDLIDYYFFYGPEIDSVISLYRTATGKVPLLAKWCYGLIHSKDKYEYESHYLAVKDGYRNNKIPVDCIVQDWGYWSPQPWGCHIMNPDRWGNPRSMISQMHEANIHTMISIWPCFAPGSNNYTELNNAGALWPVTGGSTRFVDAYHANGMSIYWRQINTQLLTAHGWDGWWNDNNEPYPYPDPFNRHALTTAMGKGCLYYNTYSLEIMKNGYNNWRRDIPNKRPALLSRVAFAGQQRTGSIQWNNDISCNWGALQNSIPAGLHFCASGNPYWCTDIGGYWGHSLNWATSGNRELFTRWFQYGAFCPIFRIHGGGSRELYSSNWDATTKANLLMIDKLHYRLMPYIYSLGWMVTNEDYTMMRHLVMDFRTDPGVKNIGNQFMFGPALLVSPITSAGATSRSMYLPAGNWYDFWTGAVNAGAAGRTTTASAPIDKIPLHVRAGSVLPMGPEIQYATERADTIELRVYPGKNGSFTLYEDEGDNYNYETGKYATIPITYTDNPRNVIIGSRSGSFTGMDTKKVFNIVYVASNHGAGPLKTANPDCQLIYTGSQVSCTPVNVMETGNHSVSCQTATMTVRAVNNRIVLPPAYRGKRTQITLFDCSGRVLRKIITDKDAIDLGNDGYMAQRIVIMKLSAAKKAGR
ncbi:MAG: glycoside hydrolase family 31 protein [Chitinispirillaceae bacterium]|nr:glycoside hydrolase family 31 protein [Chitinispirillaceae bacterium]